MYSRKLENWTPASSRDPGVKPRREKQRAVCHGDSRFLGAKAEKTKKETNFPGQSLETGWKYCLSRNNGKKVALLVCVVFHGLTLGDCKLGWLSSPLSRLQPSSPHGAALTS